MILDVSRAYSFGVHGNGDLILNTSYTRLMLLHNDRFKLALTIPRDLNSLLTIFTDDRFLALTVPAVCGLLVLDVMFLVPQMRVELCLQHFL